MGTIDMKLEVVTLPVSDVDRAKRFYQSLGWRLDADLAVGDELPGGPDDAAPLAVLDPLREGPHGVRAGVRSSRLILAVDDIDAAREDLISRGVEVSEVYEQAASRASDSPEGRSYFAYASFSDPDGNGWLLQEITTRLPGREWED